MGNCKSIVKTTILLVFITLQFLNLDVGWADNGDFMRIASWFTSGPAGKELYPLLNTEDWNQRFYYYFVPDWNLDFPYRAEMFNSAVLLWIPGVLLNQFVYSVVTLHLPVMSLGTRAMLFIFLLLVFKWIDRRSPHPLIYYLTIALPLVLLFSTEDIAAFFNSFYQENGAIVFIPFLIAVIILGRWTKRDWKYYGLYFLAITLVATSRTASFYWPILVVPYVIPLSQIRRSPTRMLGLAALLVVVPTVVSLNFTTPTGTSIARPYNALFRGTLLLSKEPQQRLEELGMADQLYCVDKDYFAPHIGFECAFKYPEKISYWAVLQTMLHEPGIVLKQLDYLLNSMQNYSLHLGKYAYGDELVRRAKRVNFWSFLKKSFFPKGWLIAGLMPVFGGLIWIGWKRNSLMGDLAVCALIFLCAFWVDSMVEIWGDGQRDLLKHLVMPNMFFDYLWIAALNLALFLGIDLAHKSRKVEEFEGGIGRETAHPSLRN